MLASDVAVSAVALAASAALRPVIASSSRPVVLVRAVPNVIHHVQQLKPRGRSYATC